jgi:hypothetical protein
MVNFKDLRTSTKISTPTKRASALALFMMTTMVAGFLFAAPSLSTAQQQTNTGTGTVTTVAARKTSKCNGCHN